MKGKVFLDRIFFLIFFNLNCGSMGKLFSDFVFLKKFLNADDRFIFWYFCDCGL